MTITKFDSQSVDITSNVMMEALEKAGTELGVTFNRKTIRYGEADFRVTIVATVNESNRSAGALTKEEKAYNHHCHLKNLPDLGSSYLSSNGLRMTVVGFNTRARKYPIMLKDERGRGRKCSVDNLKHMVRTQG